MNKKLNVLFVIMAYYKALCVIICYIIIPYTKVLFIMYKLHHIVTYNKLIYIIYNYMIYYVI